MKKYFFCIFLLVLSTLLYSENKAKWEVSVEIDPITDKRIITFILPSTDTGRFNEPSYLFIRYDENSNKKDILISWENANMTDDTTSIIVRFDKEEAMSIPSTESTSSGASFIDDNLVQDFLIKMKTTKQFVVRADLYNVTITRIFDLTGFNEATAPYLAELGLE